MVAVADLGAHDLLLPSPIHGLRRLVDAALLTAAATPRVIGEAEAPVTLGRAVRSGIGSTILPASVAADLRDADSLTARRLVEPELALTMSLCSSDLQPLSEPAAVVRELVVDVVDEFADRHGLRRPARSPSRIPMESSEMRP